MVAANELAEPVTGRRWAGLDGLVGQVSLDVLSEAAGCLIAAVAVLVEGLHDDPVEVAANELRELGRLSLALG